MGDNVKAIFGAGSDLQIYHDGSNSFIKDAGTGNLLIQSDANTGFQNASGTEWKVEALTDGAVNIYYDGSQKLATTSTGIDVTGTVTADGLTVDGFSYLSGMQVRDSSNAARGYVQGDADGLLLATDGARNITFDTNAAERMRIKTDGNVQINGQLHFTDTGSLIARPTTNALSFNTNGTEAMRIDSSGNVGIGTSSPQADLMIGNADGASRSIVIHTMNNGDARLRFREGSTVTSGYNEYSIGMDGGDNAITFETQGNGEVMRIDSSGNLLVGKTATSLAVAGARILPTGQVYSTASGAAAFAANRLSSDGNIMELYKDTGLVGSIGTGGGRPYFVADNGSNGGGFKVDSTQFYPVDRTGAVSNGVLDLGYSSGRWKDLYLSGGVYLGGTGAANLLDDFEEGQFDVTISPATSGTISISTSYDKMRYTKVGNIVHVQGEIRVAAVSSPVGADVRINNLPFAALNGTDFAGRVGGATYYYQGSSTSIQVKAFRVVEQESRIRFAVDASTVTAGDEFAFNFTYTVA